MNFSFANILTPKFLFNFSIVAIIILMWDFMFWNATEWRVEMWQAVHCGQKGLLCSAGGSFHLPNSVHEEATIWPTKEDKKAMISNANSAWWCRATEEWGGETQVSFPLQFRFILHWTEMGSKIVVLLFFLPRYIAAPFLKVNKQGKSFRAKASPLANFPAHSPFYEARKMMTPSPFCS